MSATGVLEHGPETAAGGASDLGPPHLPGDFGPEGDDNDDPNVQAGIDAIERMLADEAEFTEAGKSDVDESDSDTGDLEYGRGYRVESVSRRTVSVLGGVATRHVAADRLPERQLVMPVSHRRLLGRASMDPGVASLYSSQRGPRWYPS
jgi:hypothetical protein